jgi:antitoxin component of RelBE/YafQ-DinJ toxin-antitoxin module
MNITISVDDRLVENARKIAQSQGVSLQDLIRKFLEGVAGSQSPKAAADELLSLMNEQGGHSGGQRFRREDAYEDRL